MLNTAQRLFNYITQNETDGRSKPDLITCRQARRIKKKARRGEPHTVVVEIEDFGPVPDPVDDLKAMTVAELKAMAKDRGLKGYSALKKAELVSLLVES